MQRRGGPRACVGSTCRQHREAGLDVRGPLGREAKWRQTGEECEPTQCQQGLGGVERKGGLEEGLSCGGRVCPVQGCSTEQRPEGF